MAPSCQWVVLLSFGPKPIPDLNQVHVRHKPDTSGFPRCSHHKRQRRPSSYKPIHETNRRTDVSILRFIQPYTTEKEYPIQPSRSPMTHLQYNRQILGSGQHTTIEPRRQRIPKTPDQKCH